ncbi:MAG: glycosyltransferase family 92 protein, partial [Balneolaceae bacterium]|nr:glycosyltransferase family 92 protein [Balneolaceae bacterium]
TVHDWTNFSSKYEGPTYFFQKNRNHLAYMHAARNYRDETDWLLKIDMDEFLVMADENQTVPSWLKKVDYDRIRTVRIPRIDFGHNGHETKPAGGVVENYLRREEEASNYKDLANTSYLDNNTFCFSSHRWSYQLFPRGKMLEIEGIDQLRINHYYTKSKQEYFDRQNISNGRKITEEDFRNISERTNRVYDDSALRYLPLETEQFTDKEQA